VRDLLNSGATDQDGKSLSPGTDYGGYRIYGASKHGELVIKEHLIDPASKLSTPFYGTYVYAEDLYFVPTLSSSWDPNTDAPYTVSTTPGDTTGITTYIDYSNGTTTGGCPYSDYSDAYFVTEGSSNATVSRVGCGGVVTGTQIGSASISARETDVIIDSFGDTGELFTFNSAQITVVGSQCFAQLKYRPVYVSGIYVANHSFWWMQNSTPAHYVISGENISGYLNDFVVFGDVGYMSYDRPYYDSLAWDSGTSGSVCVAVNTIYTYALGWPQNSVGYYYVFSNSNTLAHDIANAAGLNPTPAPNARGW